MDYAGAPRETETRLHNLILCRWLYLLPSFSDVALLIPVLVLFWCTSGVGWLLTDSDTGWHIRTGDWILRYGRVPQIDFFSFTRIGQSWIAWEWLSDLLIAAAHRLGGLAGLVILTLALLGATAVCVYRNCLIVSGHRLSSITLTWLAMSASTIHWLARPHLVSPLMAALFCRVLNSEHQKTRRISLWILPALTVLWVNLHGGFFVGIVLVVTYGFGIALEKLVRGRRTEARQVVQRFTGLTLACTLASFLNPYGYHLHVHVARYLSTPFYLERISEFQSVNFHSSVAAYFETLLFLAIAAAIWHLNSGRLAHVILLLGWSHFALFSARNIPLFTVITTPSIAMAAREWLEWRDSQKLSLWRTLCAALNKIETGIDAIAGNKSGLQWHLVPCVGFLVLTLVLLHPGSLKPFRAEFDPDRFPVEGTAFLSQQRNVQLRMYASWQWGGYLIYRLWPSVTVFDDGRTDFYEPAFVQDGLCVENACREWVAVLARNSVNAALVAQDSPLTTVLRANSSWVEIYQDHTAVLFEKRE